MEGAPGDALKTVTWVHLLPFYRRQGLSWKGLGHISGIFREVILGGILAAMCGFWGPEDEISGLSGG